MTNRLLSRDSGKYRIISTTMTEATAIREAARYDAKITKLTDEEKKREAGANYAVVVKVIGLFGA